MKYFELLKCDTEKQSVQMLWKNGADRLAQYKVATNLQLLKNTVSIKCNNLKYNKVRCPMYQFPPLEYSCLGLTLSFPTF